MSGYEGLRRHSPLHIYYRVLPEKKRIEVLHFWHTARRPLRLQHIVISIHFNLNSNVIGMGIPMSCIFLEIGMKTSLASELAGGIACPSVPGMGRI